MPKNSTVRTHTRPAHQVDIVCFYPKYDQWLSLDQYQYLKSLNSEELGTAVLKQDPVLEEVSASGTFLFR
jgi:hypothetical protein